MIGTYVISSARKQWERRQTGPTALFDDICLKDLELSCYVLPIKDPSDTT